jgi:hypothetical protein
MIEILEQLVTKGRASLLKFLPLNSCVSSTRFAREILGNQSYAQPVYCMIISKDNIALVGRNLLDTTGWNGHLVVIYKTAEQDYLVDMSLDQVDGMPAMYFSLNPSFHLGIPQIFQWEDTNIIYWQDTKAGAGFTMTDAWSKKWQEAYEDYKAECE